MSILLERAEVIRRLPVRETPTTMTTFKQVRITRLIVPHSHDEAKYKALGFTKRAKTPTITPNITPDLLVSDSFYLNPTTGEVIGFHTVSPTPEYRRKSKAAALAVTGKPLIKPDDPTYFTSSIAEITATGMDLGTHINSHPFPLGTRYKVQPANQDGWRIKNDLIIFEPYDIKDTISPTHETTRVITSSAYFYVLLLFAFMYKNLNADGRKHPYRR